MKGRAPTSEEKEFMIKIASLGCIVCRNMGYETPHVSIHHIDGRVKKGCHFHVLPLCGNHHQVPDSQKPPRWFALHANRAEFEKEYGTERGLYLQCLEILNEQDRQSIQQNR